MFKFRTMCHDAEARLREVVDLDELRSPAFKLRDDPRVTRVGKLLRRLSLDELPQLWNVLLGHMSWSGRGRRTAASSTDIGRSTASG